MSLEKLYASGVVDIGFKELAELGLVSNRETLRRWLAKGTFPAPVYPRPGKPRWVVKDLLGWQRGWAASKGEPEPLTPGVGQIGWVSPWKVTMTVAVA